ncbi:MAG: hypothetical protein ABI467_10180 [Kofleriaceae bacterium]
MASRPAQAPTSTLEASTKARRDARIQRDVLTPGAACSRIQSEVWKSRDANWVKLDGEGKQEVSKQRR